MRSRQHSKQAFQNPSLKKTILWVAGGHIIIILLLFFFPSFEKKKVPEKTLQWVTLPSPQPTSVVNTQSSEPAPAPPPAPEPKPTPAPTPAVKRTNPTPPQPKPAPIPKQSTPKPPPKPTPVKPKETPVEVKKEVVKKPKPRSVKVDLTKVVQKSTKTKAIQPDTSTVTKRLTGSLDAVQMKSTSNSSASASTIESYHLRIKNALYRAWKRPLGSPTMLEAQVTLNILPDGSIVFVRLADSSGNPAMDQSVIQAAKSAGNVSKPLPACMGTPHYQVTINFIYK